MVRTAQGNKRTQSVVRSCFIRTLGFGHHMILSLAQRDQSAIVGHICGYLTIQRVQHLLVLPGITLHSYIFVRVHLLWCSVECEPFFNHNFHSLFPCDVFAAGKQTGETTKSTGDDKTVLVTTNPRQTVDCPAVPRVTRAGAWRQSEK